MTTVYNLPSVGFEQVTFDLIVPQRVNQMEGRFTEVALSEEPYYEAEYRTVWLGYASFGQIEAFMRKLMATKAAFRGFDAFRPRPIAHNNGRPLTGTRAGGGAFDGTADVTAVTVDTISLATLPASFQFSEGDYIELRNSALEVSLHSVRNSVQASAGGAVTLTVDPFIDTQIFTAASTANLEKPSCIMRITPGSWTAPKSWQDRNPSFSAYEVFLKDEVV